MSLARILKRIPLPINCIAGLAAGQAGKRPRGRPRKDPDAQQLPARKRAYHRNKQQIDELAAARRTVTQLLANLTLQRAALQQRARILECQTNHRSWVLQLLRCRSSAELQGMFYEEAGLSPLYTCSECRDTHAVQQPAAMRTWRALHALPVVWPGTAL